MLLTLSCCTSLSVRTVWCAMHGPWRHWGTQSTHCWGNPLVKENHLGQVPQKVASIQWTVYVERANNWLSCLKSTVLKSSLWDGPKPLLWLHQGWMPTFAQSCFLHPHRCCSQGHTPINFLQGNLHLWLHFLQDTTHTFCKSLFTKPSLITHF